MPKPILWDNQVVWLLFGVHRCDKEELEYEHLTSYRSLYEHVVSQVTPGKMCYVFLDEIQHVESYDKTAKSPL